MGKGGRAKTIRGAKLTRKGLDVASIVWVQDKKMKDTWRLASNKANAASKEMVKSYAKRWSIETAFMDLKDPRIGMFLSQPARRGRILMLCYFSVGLIILIGAAGEDVGVDRHLEANMMKKGTFCLIRKGHMLYRGLDTMREEWFTPLIQRYGELVQQYSSSKRVRASLKYLIA